TGEAGWGRRLARVAGSAGGGSAGSRWLAVGGAGQCGIPGGSAAAATVRSTPQSLTARREAASLGPLVLSMVSPAVWR
ncbi:MAG TPA: hypothetical protein VGG83_27560, partial [Trebonia sp.]